MDVISTIIEALRNKPARPPNARGVAPRTTPSGRPMDQRLRGYQLAVQEAQQMGEAPPSYDQWIAAQPAEM